MLMYISYIIIKFDWIGNAKSNNTFCLIIFNLVKTLIKKKTVS